MHWGFAGCLGPPTPKVFDEQDVKESGRLRLLYRRVFEYNAAWLYTGMYHGVFAGPPDVVSRLQATEERRAFLIKFVATSLYIARIQCSGERMFATGLLRSSIEETEYEAAETYERYKKHASAFVIAIAMRLLNSHHVESARLDRSENSAVLPYPPSSRAA